ncbi:hypothetical protein ACVWXO_008367 [Bradyrhizobium sp. LM2.7]
MIVAPQWEAGQKTDAGESVIFSWAKHPADKSDDEYTIYWELGSDGAINMGPPYAKPMELGWQAFALSLIADEATNDEKNSEPPILTRPRQLQFRVDRAG